MSLLQQLGLAKPKAQAGPPATANGSQESGAAPADEASPALSAAPDDAELERVLIEPKTVEIAPDKPVQFEAMFEYADGTTRNATAWVDWSSSDPAIAIDAKGKATARPVSASATVTATDPQTGKSAVASATVAAPPAGPSLVQIVIEPPIASLAGLAYLGQTRPPQQFKAIGLFADKTKKDITTRLDWTSSAPDVVSVEKSSGKASAGYRSGTALVTASDPASAAQGAAIAGSAKVTVTVPSVKSIEITPGNGKIAAGEKRSFKATRVYADGVKVPLDQSVTWSASGQMWVDENGEGRTLGVGTGTVKAVDKVSGVSGELKLIVEGQRSKETPFGTFTYVAGEESTVLPLLNKAVKTFGDAEALDEKLDLLSEALTAAADKIPPLEDVIAYVQERAKGERLLKLEANAARGAEKDLKLLISMLEALQEDASVAAENLTITKDDLTGAQDMARAESLMKEAQKFQQGMQTFMKVVSIGIDTAFKLSKGDPAVLKPAWDAASLVVGAFTSDVNPWLSEAKSLQDRASKLLLDNMAKKFALATKHAKALDKQIKKLGPELAGFQADDERTWKTAEGNFDDLRGGNFKFKDVKAALVLAQQAIVHARQTAETAYGAREAAKALARPAVAPSQWMANPKEDQKIIVALVQGATAMFDNAIAHRQRAETLVKRFQETHAAARKAMVEA